MQRRTVVSFIITPPPETVKTLKGLCSRTSVLYTGAKYSRKTMTSADDRWLVKLFLTLLRPIPRRRLISERPSTCSRAREHRRTNRSRPRRALIRCRQGPDHPSRTSCLVLCASSQSHSRSGPALQGACGHRPVVHVPVHTTHHRIRTAHQEHARSTSCTSCTKLHQSCTRKPLRRDQHRELTHLQVPKVLPRLGKVPKGGTLVVTYLGTYVHTLRQWPKLRGSKHHRHLHRCRTWHLQHLSARLHPSISLPPSRRRNRRNCRNPRNLLQLHRAEPCHEGLADGRRYDCIPASLHHPSL